MATVLIVDDVASVREVIGKVVSSLGHTPVYANDGGEAVEKARQVNPQLILMDVVMPNQDGFNTCRQIKSDEKLKEIPVVLVSSKSSESDKFWGQKQGANDMLAKPFTDDSLSAMVRKYLH